MIHYTGLSFDESKALNKLYLLADGHHGSSDVKVEVTAADLLRVTKALRRKCPVDWKRTNPDANR